MFLTSIMGAATDDHVKDVCINRAPVYGEVISGDNTFVSQYI